MNVDEIMTRDVETCGPDDSLETAARLMWERDFGCVPVVDSSGRVQAMLTDRDICMAAYTQGGTLRDLRVRGAMSDHVVSVSADEPIAEAERMMQEYQVRRVPVLDGDGRLQGLLSLSDVARESASRRARRRRAIAPDEVGLTLAAVCKRRVLSTEPGAPPELSSGDERWPFAGMA